jgi:hypothetical protein
VTSLASFLRISSVYCPSGAEGMIR